jgi:hypothetical protein
MPSDWLGPNDTGVDEERPLPRRTARSRWAIKVIWNDGREDMVMEGASDRVKIFTARARAQEVADFLGEGILGDEAQSVSVIVLLPPDPDQE